MQMVVSAVAKLSAGKAQNNGTIQGPQKQMGRIAVNAPDIRKDGLNPCKWLKFMSKFFEKYF